ncbi:hypothetical protein [Sorangium sp. So ce1078]|uniref:hypothetical protein n=1 Tax=Sorangium sp. So ce1078 TaxID=3133329 RepID=UPI003F627409
MIKWKRVWFRFTVAASMSWLIAICSGCHPSEIVTSTTAPMEGNLVSGLEPRGARGVTSPARLTDGVISEEGDDWKTDITCRFESSASFIEYDLGRDVRVTAAYLQGDNNDRYIVSTSLDGVEFEPMWTASPVGDIGLRQRHSAGLDRTARYVRISPSGGDGSYALSEVQLFSEQPAVFPPEPEVRRGTPADTWFRSTILWFGMAISALVFWARRGQRWWLAALVSLAATFVVVTGLNPDIWPVGQREISLIRAAVAAVALAAVVREALAQRNHAPEPRVVVGVLGLTASMAIAAFYNLGQPQFWDHKHHRPSVIHNYDMRVYYPVAKYFHELRFDGLYLASVAALVDDVPGATVQRYGNVQLRDLNTHNVVRVRDVADQIEGVKRRFSPERWREFKRDMRYFRETMGTRDYLGTLIDHGGNATPIWFTMARLLFAHTHASDETLLLSGMLDPILLLLAFVAVWRTFGVRTMLVSATIFGANDFYMFGTNWAGATLRHDWMVALALGACALRRERWMLGGALLAYAALIRAFPALALVTMVLPALWWIGHEWKKERRLPSVRRILEHERGTIRAVLGAFVCIVALVLLSFVVLDPAAWASWGRKVSLLNREALVNQVSLRVLVGYDAHHTIAALDRIAGALGWEPSDQLMQRVAALLTGVVAALFMVAVVVAARGKRIEQAALLGLFLVPIVFNPMNYYVHMVFLFALLAVERPSAANGEIPPVRALDAWIWCCLLGMCVAQYKTVLEPRVDTHFYGATVVLFAGMVAILGSLVLDQYRRGRQSAMLPRGPARAPLEHLEQTATGSESVG